MKFWNGMTKKAIADVNDKILIGDAISGESKYIDVQDILNPDNKNFAATIHIDDSIPFNATAPQPKTIVSGVEVGCNGYYEFSTAGVCSWLPGTPTVKVGDRVSVKFTAPSTYAYTHIPVDLTNTDLYNVTIKVPLAAGSYYTATTARAAVPTNIKKLGLKITYATASGVWVEETYIGSDLSGWGTDTNWKNDIKNLNVYIDDKSSKLDGEINGINEDIYTKIAWIKATWHTGTNYPNGVELGFNSVQLVWHSPKIDISDYEKVTCVGLLNGSAISNTADRMAGINIYGDDVLIGSVVDASGTNIIYRSNYSQYAKLEILLQDKALDTGNTFNGTGNVVVEKQATTILRTEIQPILEAIENNTAGIDKLSTEINGINEDIYPELTWIKATWHTGTNQPNGVQMGYNSVQWVWYTRIDISDYDSVTLNSLLNGGVYSNNSDRLSGINLYGDGNLIYYKDDASGTNTIYRSDYSQYTLLELVIQDKALADVATFNGAGTVQVVKSAIGKEIQNAKRLVIVGDSLCGNLSGLIIKELNSILSSQGYDPVISNAMGGENIIGNLTRAGGLGIRVKSEFTLPTNGSVNVDLGSAWMKSDGTYSETPYNSIDSSKYVIINGVKCLIAKQSISAVGIAFYDSLHNKLATYTGNQTISTPANSAYYRFSINNPQTGVAHITINGSSVDITSNALITGYINTSGDLIVDNGYLSSNYISINSGISVYFDSLATSTGYSLTRLTAGIAMKIGVGSIFFDSALYDEREYTHIWFTGQNGGYENESDWAAMINSATRNFGEKFIVCSTALERTTNSLVREATKTFGNKYLNLKAYTEGEAVYDGQRYGLIPVEYRASDFPILFWPGTDKIHQNNMLSYIWAVKMWNQLLELGYVSGQIINTGNLYVS